MNKIDNPALTDAMLGTVTLDIPAEVWGQFSVQGKISFIAHQLLDFMSNPAYHAPNLRGVRFQVREPGIVMAKEVVAHIGDRLIIEQGGAI